MMVHALGNRQVSSRTMAILSTLQAGPPLLGDLEAFQFLLTYQVLDREVHLIECAGQM